MSFPQEARRSCTPQLPTSKDMDLGYTADVDTIAMLTKEICQKIQTITTQTDVDSNDDADTNGDAGKNDDTDDTNDDAYPNDDADANADVKRRGSG